MKKITLVVAVLVASIGAGCNHFREAAYDRQWKEGVALSYDQDALLAFLKQCIAAHPEIEGIDLSESRVGEAWVFHRLGPGWGGPGVALVCGDWAFSTGDPSERSFELTWDYAYPKLVMFRCSRIGIKQYQLKRVEKTEWLIP